MNQLYPPNYFVKNANWLTDLAKSKFMTAGLNETVPMAAKGLNRATFNFGLPKNDATSAITGGLAALGLGAAAVPISSKVTESITGKPLELPAQIADLGANAYIALSLTTPNGRRKAIADPGAVGIKKIMSLLLPGATQIAGGQMKNVDAAGNSLAQAADSLKETMKGPESAWGNTGFIKAPDGSFKLAPHEQWVQMHKDPSTIPRGYTLDKEITLGDRANAAGNAIRKDLQEQMKGLGSGFRNALAGPVVPLVTGATGGVIGNLVGGLGDVPENNAENVRKNKIRHTISTLLGGALGAGAGYYAQNMKGPEVSQSVNDAWNKLKSMTEVTPIKGASAKHALIFALAEKRADEQLKKKVKHTDYTLPVALGSLGVGLGATHLANKMFSPKDEALIQQGRGFLEDIDKATPPEQVDTYVRKMTDAVNGKAFGLTARDVFEKVRSLPEWIIGEGNKWKPGPEGSGRHYTRFQQGRITALREEIPGGYGWDSIAQKELFKPGPADVSSEAILPRYDKAVADTAKFLGITPDQAKMTQAEQAKIYEVIHEHIAQSDPELHATMRNLENVTGPILARNMHGYAGAIDSAINFRDILRGTGVALGAAGAGLGGYWAWRKYMEHKHEQEGKKMKPLSFNLPVGGATLKLANAQAENEPKAVDLFNKVLNWKPEPMPTLPEMAISGAEGGGIGALTGLAGAGIAHAIHGHSKDEEDAKRIRRNYVLASLLGGGAGAGIGAVAPSVGTELSNVAKALMYVPALALTGAGAAAEQAKPGEAPPITWKHELKGVLKDTAKEGLKDFRNGIRPTIDEAKATVGHGISAAMGIPAAR